MERSGDQSPAHSPINLNPQHGGPSSTSPSNPDSQPGLMGDSDRKACVSHEIVPAEPWMAGGLASDGRRTLRSHESLLPSHSSLSGGQGEDLLEATHDRQIDGGEEGLPKTPQGQSHFFPETWTARERTFDGGTISSLNKFRDPTQHSWFFGEFLVRHYLRSTRASAGSLDELLKAISYKDPLRSSRYLQAALSKRWFFIWLITVTAVFWPSFIYIIVSRRYDSVYSSTAFRMVAMREQSGAASTTPGIRDFGLKFYGCVSGLSYGAKMSSKKADLAGGAGDLAVDSPMMELQGVEENLGNLTVQGPVMTLNFSKSISMNGWYFTRLDTTTGPERHPVIFRLDALIDSRWETIGGPSYGLAANHPVFVAANDDEFSIQRLWQFYFFTLSGRLCFGLAASLAAILSAIGDVRSGGVAFAGGFALHGLVSVITLILLRFMSDTSPEDTSSFVVVKTIYVQASIYAVFNFLCVYAFSTSSKRIFDAMFLYALALVVEYWTRVMVIEYEPALSTPPAAVQPLGFTTNCLLLCAPFLGQLIGREIRARACDKFSRSGVQRWSTLWTALFSRNPKGFAQLKEKVATFQVKGAARQCNRLRKKHWIGSRIATASRIEALNIDPFESVVVHVLGLGQSGSADPSNPVKSISQLFAQAEGLQRFLFHKSVSWAVASDGLMMSNRGDLVKCDFSMDKSQLFRPKLKTPQRAIEKILRAYHGDPSYLLDLCRGVIVFERVEEVTECLDLIFGDPEAVVVRVKNMMDPDYDGAVTAGWRGVIVNFRLDMEITRLLGIETHVCELQLLLKDYFLGTAAQPASAHQGYLHIRDCRADRPLWRRTDVKRTLQAACNMLVGSRAIPDGDGIGGRDLEAGRSPIGALRSARIFRNMQGNSSVSPATGVDTVHKFSTHFDEENIIGSYRTSLKELFATNPESIALPDEPEGGSTSAESPDQVTEGDTHRSRRCSNSSKASSDGSDADALLMWRRFFLSQYLNSTLGVGGFMERKLKKVSNAMAAASGASAFFTSKPIANIMTKTVYRIILSAIVVYFAWVGMRRALSFESTYSSSGSVFRFTALETRGGTSPPLGEASIASFGLFWNGCSITNERDISVGAEGNVVTLVYDKPVRMNGYYLKTRDGDASLDPARWMIEAKLSPSDQKWQLVGASHLQYPTDGLLMDPSVRRNLPLDREAVVKFDHRVPNYIAFLELHIVCIFVPVFTLMIILAVLDEYTNQHTILSCGLILTFVTNLVAGAISAKEQQDVAAYHALGEGFVNLVSGLVIFRREDLSFHAMVFTGTTYCVLWLSSGWVGRNPNTAMIGLTINYTGLGIFVLSIVVLVSRYFTLRRAKNLVQRDNELYTSAWNDVCIGSDNTEAIRELCDVARNGLTWASCEGRQYNRATTQGGDQNDTGDSMREFDRDASLKSNLLLPTGSAVARALSSDNTHQALDKLREEPPERVATNNDDGISSHMTSFTRSLWRKTLSKQPWLRGGITDEEVDDLIDGCPGIIDTSSPVKSIDQLYAQAAGLDIVLLRFTQSWAFASNGSFFKTGGGLARWRDAKSDLDVAKEIKWGTLKSPKRAIEKLIRAYRGDVSQLLDICRQSIVFDTVSELLTCVKIIMEDPSVVVIRIKNRLNPMYDGVETAGYRDVSLNLRLDNGMTRDLGVETHVCEVKLLLTPFALLKSDNGHQRYVRWRNIRGE